jgi:hypothetical protein
MVSVNGFLSPLNLRIKIRGGEGPGDEKLIYSSINVSFSTDFPEQNPRKGTRNYSVCINIAVQFPT